LARRAAGGFFLYLLSMCTLTYISSSSLGLIGSYSRILPGNLDNLQNNVSIPTT
jgi:hypothetical protein